MIRPKFKMGDKVQVARAGGTVYTVTRIALLSSHSSPYYDLENDGDTLSSIHESHLSFACVNGLQKLRKINNEKKI